MAMIRRRSFIHLLQVAVVVFACLAQFADAFTLRDSEGKTHSLAALKGKWVVVNFWATWCAPCIKEIPDLAAFARAHPDNTLVLGVALDYDDIGVVKTFARKVGLSYPLVLGDGQAEKQFGRIKGLPTTLVYDPSGKQVLSKTGGVTRTMLESLLKHGNATGA